MAKRANIAEEGARDTIEEPIATLLNIFDLYPTQIKSQRQPNFLLQNHNTNLAGCCCSAEVLNKKQNKEIKI
jgi:hypothetical protein